MRRGGSAQSTIISVVTLGSGSWPVSLRSAGIGNISLRVVLGGCGGSGPTCDAATGASVRPGGGTTASVILQKNKLVIQTQKNGEVMQAESKVLLSYSLPEPFILCTLLCHLKLEGGEI